MEILPSRRILGQISVQGAIPWIHCRAGSVKHLEDMGAAEMQVFRMAYISK